jgi:FkbM family methyltransferase
MLGTPQGNVVVRQPWGSSIELNPSELVGRAIWTTGVTDLVVCESICRLLSAGDTAYDVGANIAFMTGLMAARVGPKGIVECFEPNPNILPLLKRNLDRIADAGFCRPTLHECAVTERSGSMNLICPTSSDGNDGIARLTTDKTLGPEIRVVSLDETHQESKQINFMKVDVEGFEASVFRGASKLLKTRKIDCIVFEEHRTVDEAESFTVLQEFNYHVFRLGWNASGVYFAPLSTVPIHSIYEPANFIATYDPHRLETAFKRPGYRVFDKKHWQSLHH